MELDEAVQRLEKVAGDGWKCPITLLTDGLTEPCWGGRNAIDDKPEVFSKHVAMLTAWMRVTGQITLRLQHFHPDMPEFVAKPVVVIAQAAKDVGARIDLAVKPFGQKYTPGEIITPKDSSVFQDLLGYWLPCLYHARQLGIAPRYFMIDHPPNMDDWRAGRSEEIDNLIADRWNQMLDLFQTFCSCGSDADLIVFGTTLGDVLPESVKTGWLSCDGYKVNDNANEDERLFGLVLRQRQEKLAWWHDVRREDEHHWGRIFADRIMGEEYAERIDAVIVSPGILSSPESMKGVVELLEGLKG